MRWSTVARPDGRARRTVGGAVRGRTGSASNGGAAPGERAAEVLLEDRGFYRLSRRVDGRLELEVVCGTLGSYEVRWTLTPEEEARFREFGEFAVRGLALRIARSGRVP